MVIYEYPLKEKYNISECVLALGFFDGVHIAHRDLLVRAKKIAKQRNLPFGIFTFSSSGSIKKDAKRLYNDGEKAEMFELLGADFTVFADFGAISGCSPDDFVRKILAFDLGCRICVAGFNFRFGKGASGDSALLASLMKNAGGEALILDEITDGNTTISATLIREHILSGNIETAGRLLGAPYFVKGRVLHGRADGRKLGFPTANIRIEEGRIIPKSGVYRSALVIDGRIFCGVSNIGVCPTFNGREIRLETHIIDFSGDLYDKEIRIYLLGYIREERHFNSIEELKKQIIVDKNTTIKENGEITWRDLGLK